MGREELLMFVETGASSVGRPGRVRGLLKNGDAPIFDFASSQTLSQARQKCISPFIYWGFAHIRRVTSPRLGLSRFLFWRLRAAAHAPTDDGEMVASEVAALSLFKFEKVCKSDDI